MFTTRFTRSFAGTTLVAGALGLAAIVGAGAASAAGDTDSAFVATLQQAGISGNAQAEISLGHAVCQALNQGHSAQEVVQAVAGATSLSPAGAKDFALISAAAYCPSYVS
jgi:Protein of unknown function (DUF732)